MRKSSLPSTPRLSASKSPFVSFFNLERMFHCGCSSSDVYNENEDPDYEYNETTQAQQQQQRILTQTNIYRKHQILQSQLQQQQQQLLFNSPSSFDRTAHADTNKLAQPPKEEEKEIETESAKDYVDRIKNLQLPAAPSIEHILVPKRKPFESISAISSTNSNTEKTTNNNKKKTKTNKKKKPQFEMLIKGVLLSPGRRRGGLKQSDSNSTASTKSMSEDEQDDHNDDLSFDQDEHDEHVQEEQQEEAPQQFPLPSILRRKEGFSLFGSVRTSNTNTAVVRFHEGTKFPDPNEIPVKRKKVPRLNLAQRKALFQHYHQDTYTTTTPAPSSSPSIVPHLTPSLSVITTHNNDEFRDYSNGSNSSRDYYHQEQRRKLERVQRRAQQQQYQQLQQLNNMTRSSSHSPQSTRTRIKTLTPEEQFLQLSLSSSSGFYVFR